MTKGEESSFEEAEEEMVAFLDESESKKGLWENIRDKKKREGKNYKPAKPGDKDYPDPKALKKAQKSSEEKKSKADKKEEKKDGESGLTDEQKKLPDFIKKNLLKKKKAEADKHGKEEKDDSGLTDKQKKLPDFIKKNLKNKKNKKGEEKKQND